MRRFFLVDLQIPVFQSLRKARDIVGKYVDQLNSGQASESDIDEVFVD